MNMPELIGKFITWVNEQQIIGAPAWDNDQQIIGAPAFHQMKNVSSWRTIPRIAWGLGSIEINVETQQNLKLI